MSARENAEFYAKGYAEGLRDAKHIDVAHILHERDHAREALDMERILRLDAENALAARAGTVIAFKRA